MGVESVTSTKTKVNVEKADQILSRYALRYVRFLIDKNGYLRAVGEKGRCEKWPLAVPTSVLPKKENYEDEEDYWHDVEQICRETDGFTVLLRQLAGCIESPMTILAVRSDSDTDSSAAYLWRIEPGAEQMQELDVYDGPEDLGEDD
jgi:hypothetical protein